MRIGALERQTKADTRPTELIVRLSDTGEVERYDLWLGPGWGQRLDAGQEQEANGDTTETG